MAPHRSLRIAKASAAAIAFTALKVKTKTAKVSKKENLQKTNKRRSVRVTTKIQDAAKGESISETEGTSEAEDMSETEENSVIFLENGLVSMEKSPKNLVNMYVQGNITTQPVITSVANSNPSVEKNANTSALLPLPGELRNKIWAFAMGGHYIKVKEVIHSKTKESYFMKTVFRAQTTLTDKTHHSSAFHLPEVCRQIYSETATLGYSLNTFIVDFDMSSFSREWVKSLLPAQKIAVTSIVPETVFFEPYVSGSIAVPLRKRFPNLKKIEVPGDAVALVRVFNRHADPTGVWAEHQWRDWCVEQVKKKEGSDIDVFFHEPEEAEKEEAEGEGTSD